MNIPSRIVKTNCRLNVRAGPFQVVKAVQVRTQNIKYTTPDSMSKRRILVTLDFFKLGPLTNFDCAWLKRLQKVHNTSMGVYVGRGERVITMHDIRS